MRYRSASTRTREHLDFADGRVTGWVGQADGDSSVVGAAAADVYNTSTIDLVLRASTLREGWDVQIPVFVPTSRALAQLRARVTGVERVGDEPCWRVLVDFLGMPATFWVGQTSRALQQQMLQLRPGVQLLFLRLAPGARGSRTE